MRKPPKEKPNSLGLTLLNAFFPKNYEPPRNRVRPPLVGWSGLETDEPPQPGPFGWGQGPSSRV